MARHNLTQFYVSDVAVSVTFQCFQRDQVTQTETVKGQSSVGTSKTVLKLCKY